MELPDIPRESSEEKAIGIIGAGPSGLAALKIILDTPQFKRGSWNATAFEARENVGGVWLPAPPVDDPPLTPLYDSLTTNLPHPVMGFTSFSFPPSTPVFPHADRIQQYLEAYAEHFKLYPHIQLNTRVEAVEREDSRWKVKLSNGETRFFDLVVVANGHYRKPRYPDTPGLDDWIKAEKATHSAWYRRPHDLGKVVLIVGAGPSGTDLTAEMSLHATTVIQSVSGSTPEDIGNIKRRGRVVEYKDNGQVVFEDGSIESNIDHCILATGYEMSLPFFSESIFHHEIPQALPPIPRELYNSSYHIFPLAKHVFPLNHPNIPPSSLAFIGLLLKVAPFPIVEAQARAMVHVFAHPHTLDTTQEAVDIMTRYEDLVAEFGTDDPLTIAQVWHRIKNQEQYDHRDQLYAFSDVTNTGLEGIEGRVVTPAWEKQMFEEKDILRKFWVDLEKKGLAEDWVKGVGENGPHEWVDLLEKMLREAKKQQSTESKL